MLNHPVEGSEQSYCTPHEPQLMERCVALFRSFQEKRKEFWRTSENASKMLAVNCWIACTTASCGQSLHTSPCDEQMHFDGEVCCSHSLKFRLPECTDRHISAVLRVIEMPSAYAFLLQREGDAVGTAQIQDQKLGMVVPTKEDENGNNPGDGVFTEYVLKSDLFTKRNVDGATAPQHEICSIDLDGIPLTVTHLQRSMNALQFQLLQPKSVGFNRSENHSTPTERCVFPTPDGPILSRTAGTFPHMDPNPHWKCGEADLNPFHPVEQIGTRRTNVDGMLMGPDYFRDAPRGWPPCDTHASIGREHLAVPPGARYDPIGPVAETFEVFPMRPQFQLGAGKKSHGATFRPAF